MEGGEEAEREREGKSERLTRGPEAPPSVHHRGCPCPGSGGEEQAGRAKRPDREKAQDNTRKGKGGQRGSGIEKRGKKEWGKGSKTFTTQDPQPKPKGEQPHQDSYYQIGVKKKYLPAKSGEWE